ncbi:hypothetical protein ACFVY9_03755 [Streptomyces sp. NPDC059544]|uniref:hypothetical protein n=1 Tax=Streptomyces sp. NPDC059544 TaxID=3346861 RepID=UPI0036CE1277
MSMEDALVRERPLYDRGKPIDAVLEDLRAVGFGMIDCIKAVRELRACSLAEAKKIAHTSPAWADLREAHDAAHAALAAEAEREAQRSQS